MIKLSHIEKTYESPSGPVYALKGIDLTIERGEIYGIIGLSGAGKSTLIRCINMDFPRDSNPSSTSYSIFNISSELFWSGKRILSTQRELLQCMNHQIFENSPYKSAHLEQINIQAITILLYIL